MPTISDLTRGSGKYYAAIAERETDVWIWNS